MPDSPKSSNFARKRARWSRYTPVEKLAFVYFSFSLPLVWIALRTIGFTRLVRWMRIDVEPITSTPAHIDHTANDAVSFARVCEAAGRNGIYDANCLHRSIALYTWLRRRDIPATLRVGVAREDEEFKAHAWIESNGVSLDDSSIRFAPFDTLSPKPQRATR
jgi:hypothetical protein